MGESGATRVAFDSLNALFSLYDDHASLRQEIFRITATLKKRSESAYWSLHLPAPSGEVVAVSVAVAVASSVRNRAVAAGTAVFGEMTWHITDNLDLTAGGRYFERENTNFYFVDHPGGPNHSGEPDATAGDAAPGAAGATPPAAARLCVENPFVEELQH